MDSIMYLNKVGLGTNNFNTGKDFQDSQGQRCPYHRVNPGFVETPNSNQEVVSDPSQVKILLYAKRRALLVLWWTESDVRQQLEACQATDPTSYLDNVKSICLASLRDYCNEYIDREYESHLRVSIAEDNCRGVHTAVNVMSQYLPAFRSITFEFTPELRAEVYANSFEVIAMLARQHLQHFYAQSEYLAENANPTRKINHLSFKTEKLRYEPKNKKITFADQVLNSDVMATANNPKPRTGCPALPILPELWSIVATGLGKYK